MLLYCQNYSIEAAETHITLQGRALLTAVRSLPTGVGSVMRLFRWRRIIFREIKMPPCAPSDVLKLLRFKDMK